MWKDMVKKIEDRVLLDDLDIKLHIRDNIFKLQSLVHNQFSASRFEPFIRYAWHKAGYIEERPVGKFQTPVQFCFNVQSEVCMKNGYEDERIETSDLF